MSRLPFTKMQAAGNDFVVIDHLIAVPVGFRFDADLVRKLSHRQFGVGCDQILWLKPGPKKRESDERFDAEVEILNPDGSRAEMCGNGMRAIGVYLRDRGPHRREKAYCVLTDSGAVEIDLSGPFPEVALGPARVEAVAEKIRLSGGESEFSRVSVGNPHAVFFRAGIDGLDLAVLGSEIENHPAFPNRTNVEFVEVVSPTKIRVRVWERGAGATLACGSGACAAAAAAEARGRVTAGEKIEVEVPGGTLFVRLPAGWKMGESVVLAGPAVEVFRGEISI